MKNNILYDNFKNYDLNTLVESKSYHCPCCNDSIDYISDIVAISDSYEKFEHYETIYFMCIYVCPNCNTTFKLENGA